MRRFFNDMKKFYAYAKYSAIAELKSEVAGSYLNWIWWILEPFCLMLIYAFIFGFVFDAREQYFTAFIYIGLTIWNFFNQCVKVSVSVVKKNKSVVGKVYLPKFILIEKKMFVNAFKMAISFGIIILLMMVYRVPISFQVFFVIPILLLLIMFTFGIGCVMLHFGVFVEDLSNVITILLRLMFYMTGIMFSIEHRIGPKHPYLASILLKLNPIAYLISSARSCLLYQETPDLMVMMIWYLISFILSVCGVCLIYRSENRYVKVV